MHYNTMIAHYRRFRYMDTVALDVYMPVFV